MSVADKLHQASRLLVLLAVLGCSEPADPADDPMGAAGFGGTAVGGGAGGGSSSAGSSNAGSSNAGSSNAGSPNGGSSNAGSSNGGKSNAGSSNGGSSNGGSNGGLAVSDLASLAVDNRWTYTVTGDGFACPVGSQSTTVESFAPFAGRDAYQVRDLCSPEDLTAYSYEGDSLLQNYGPMEWHPVMASPIKDGASWVFIQDVTIAWHAVASITVPAGTFSNCFMRTVSQSPNLQTTFCPGVGQVRRADDGYVAVLESYELH